ncbi:hypothetical protein SAMN06265375_1221 [Muriicola jejuensis]|nr:hypothetical protein SAMN06265375_1221 [Muriicola jejuensis]
MNNYSINGNFIFEGFGLENNGGLFQWFYTERGNRETLKYFVTEKDAVKFALKKIHSDEHAKRNYLGMYKSDSEVEQILMELNKREIEYWTDKILYGPFEDWRTRIFVIGCGINKALDLKQKTA